MILMWLLIALFLFFTIKNAFDKRKGNANPYIDQHQKKMNDDQLYSEYLEFCKKNNETAMEKKGFDELRKKDEAHQNRLNNILK